MYRVILVLSAIVFLSSCVKEVNLVDLIPESDGSYCDQPNPDSSFDSFLWETQFNENLNPIGIDSDPLLYNDQIIVVTSINKDLVFRSYDIDSGIFLSETMADIGEMYVKNIELYSDYILVSTSRSLVVLDAKEFTVLWKKNINGFHPFNKNYEIADNVIYAPVTKEFNDINSIELLSIDIKDGTLIDSKIILTANVTQSKNFNFSTVELSDSQNELLIQYKGWLKSGQAFIEVVQYDLSNSNIAWKWSTVDDYLRLSNSRFCGDHILVVTDSIYILDRLDGNQTKSFSLDYPNYATAQHPLIRYYDGIAYLKISSVGVIAVDIQDFNIIWSSENYDLLSSNDKEIAEGKFINTSGGFKVINIGIGEESIREEMPYTCSYISEYFSFDKEKGIVYFTDSKRLYAMHIN